MKNLAVLPIDQVLPDLDDYNAIIDVRSPSEFIDDHIPGAINCPVLDDAERAEVGTLYKQVSPFVAKKVGAAYVAKNIGVHIQSAFRDKPREWKPLIYCWRGGSRSGSMAHVFASIGWKVVQLDGGYKAYRRHVLADLETLPKLFQFKVVCGATGTGKTRLLQQLAAAGAQVLDLEHLARHKGSVLGSYVYEAQPPQKLFESRIWNTLRHLDPNRIVYVESESKKIGNVRVPETLMEVIREAPCIVINIPREMRIKLLIEEYEHFTKNNALLSAKLDKLTPIFGHAVIDRWSNLAAEGKVNELVGELLDRHYDPAYAASIQRNFKQVDKAHIIVINDCKVDSYRAAAEELLVSK